MQLVDSELLARLASLYDLSDVDAFKITGTADNDYARQRREYIVTQVRESN